MLEWISWYLLSYINNIVDYLIFKKILKSKSKYNLIVIQLIFAIFAFFSTINIQTSNEIVRVVISLTLTLIMFNLIFDERPTKITLMTLIIFIGYVMSEFLATTILMIIFDIPANFFKYNLLGIILINIIIMTLYYINFSLKFLKNFIVNILNWYECKELINNIILLLTGFITIFFFIYQNYTGNITKSDFLITMIFFVGVMYMIISLLKEKGNNIKLSTRL